MSLPNEKDMLGTVGPPVPYVDVCLESIPEMGYDALGDPPRGEICVRGSTVFKGYYKREDLTKEVMTNGWFHTGSFVPISDNQYLLLYELQGHILFINDLFKQVILGSGNQMEP